MRTRSLALALLLAALLTPLASAQAPDAPDEPVPVEVEVYVINFGNFDPGKGTYVMDFYLTLRWDATTADANFTPLRFEFMNGRATGSPDRISDETDEAGVREVTYRIQSNLYNEPRFEEYPYDTQALELVFEDVTHPESELVYVPVEEGSGLDEAVRMPGWRVLDSSLSVTSKAYPGEEPYSRVRFVVHVAREPLSSSIKAFLPPVAFMLVAGLAFFFHPSKVANRITLGTGMLIAAVGFHISQTVSLPPLGSLILFDKIMIAVYAFLVGSLAVSTLIAIDEDWWKDRDYTQAINRYGAVGTFVLFLVTLLGLILL